MSRQIQYQKKDLSITIIQGCAEKGTYTKKGKEEGFKLYDKLRDVFTNSSYSGIISITALKI